MLILNFTTLGLPKRQSKDGKAADERIKGMQGIFNLFSFEGICMDMQEGLFELQPQLMKFPEASTK